MSSSMQRDASALRPEVLAFALAIEDRLRANDHKGGWQDESVHYLVGRMRQEFLEVEHELWPLGGACDAAKVRHEAADIGAFAMMIADVAGDLMKGASS